MSLPTVYSTVADGGALGFWPTQEKEAVGSFEATTVVESGSAAEPARPAGAAVAARG
eukprot:SAG11_NODE_1542_length_4717_cov_2.974881_1_plen_56_part_10